MRINRLLLIVVALLSGGYQLYAQDNSEAVEEVQGVGPEKGDFTASLNFGSRVSLGVVAPQPDLGTYTISSPSGSGFGIAPSINLEGKYFISNKWAVKLLGGFSYSYSPGYAELPGTADGAIPSYNAVPNSDKIQTFVMTGTNYYMNIGIPNVCFYTGLSFGFNYSKQDAYSDESTTYMGTSIGETYGFSVDASAGLDYYFNKTLFLGLEISPISYGYAVYSIRPQQGLSLLSADTHGFNFISNPQLKVGFRF
ncbi:MAG: BT1926 family outer membrane beta-barrel protein [Bacteroidales bacterium]